MTQDFIVTEEASVWLFEPLTKAAQDFLRRAVDPEEWFWRGRSLVIDDRMAGALAEELSDEGLTLDRMHS